MATRALDVVTVAHAINTLEKEFLGPDRKWQVSNSEQERFFRIYLEMVSYLPQITGLKAKASMKYEELNRFLTSERFAPMFRPFDPKMGIGVVSILDKFVKWLEGKATLAKVYGPIGKEYPGFSLSASGVTIYSVGGGYLAQLLTKSDDTLWLFLPPEKSYDSFSKGLDLVEKAMALVRGDKQPTNLYAGALIPKVDFNIKPDISWLLKASTFDKSGQYWFVDQAFQQFKLRMNEEGARARVATGVAVMRASVVATPPRLIFDRPFLGWFTQKGIPVPMAVFYADCDSWREPAGTLEDL